MAYVLGLLLMLIGFWLGMSGHFTTMLLSFGAASIVLTFILCRRFGIIDREGVPYTKLVSFLGYYPWLTIEVIKANWILIRACLRADLDINPALVRVKTICKTDLARVTFGNSITLTPGTVTVEIDGDRILVHALYEQHAQQEGFAEMDRRCARAADPRGAGA
jgi:multicomponent Na+:H+ antiporter subunit E